MRTMAALLIISMHLFGILAAASVIGKPRKPLAPDVFVAVVVINLALIVGVYWLWQT